MTNYKNPAPVHFALGPKGSDRYDSPCGMQAMWHRGLLFSRDRERVSCAHCRRWLRKYPERPKAVQS